MRTTTPSTPEVFELTIDPALLNHRVHLPETQSCSCGFVRDGVVIPEAAAQ